MVDVGALSQLPAKFVHESGSGMLRLQTFVLLRDEARRVALLRIEGYDGWCFPAESMRFNESPDACAVRVARTWFASPLGLALDRVLSYPATGPEDDRWYLLFVYDAVSRGEVKPTPDTLEVRWVGLDEAPPGPFAMSHADVWHALRAGEPPA